MSITRDPRKLIYVQGLRAAAACSVVLLHANMISERSSASPAVLSNIAELGRYGVDLFFVISGFVIFYTNYPKASLALEFIWKRVRRIVPLYWALTMIAFVVRQSLPPSMFVSPTPDVWDLALSVSFLSGHHPIIGVGWTLEYEAIFYVSAAVAIALVASRWSMIVYMLALASIVGPAVPEGAGPIKMLMTPLLLEFVFGMLAAELFCTGRVGAARLLAVSGATAIAYWGGWTSVVWVGLGSAIIVYWAARWSQNVHLEKARWPVRVGYELGEASYSIYLIQFFTLAGVGRLAVTAFGGGLHDLILPVAFVATIIAGYFCHIYLERPSAVLLARLTARPA